MAKKNSVPTMSVEDRKWQARSDARTLAEAKVIMGDTKRLSGAAKAAKDMAEDSKKEARAMQSVANKAPRK